MQPDKINLKRTASIERARGKVIGLCHGCFDIIHFGHVEHFKLAKSHCDILFVCFKYLIWFRLDLEECILKVLRTRKLKI